MFQTLICEHCFRISSPGKETIYPGETIEIGHYNVVVPKTSINDLKKIYIKLTLWYEDGKKEELLIDGKEDSDLRISDSKEIEEYIKKDHPDFNLTGLV